MRKRTRSDSPTKVCTLPDCERPLRARGLCATHYNQAHQPNRHPKASVPCVVCGTLVVRQVDPRRTEGHCCSSHCRTIRQFGMSMPGLSYDWATDAQARARKHGSPVVDPFSPLSATIDHVVPLSKGGEHTLANLRCCCLRCNSSKAAISPAA